MKKWEYKTLSIRYNLAGEEVLKMNELGNEGWELVNTVVSGIGFKAIFKREMCEEPQKKNAY